MKKLIASLIIFLTLMVATVIVTAAAHAVNGAKENYGACVRSAPIDSRSNMAPGQFGFGPAIFVNETAHEAKGEAFYGNSTCSLV